MSNPNMTYEELQSAMQTILARVEPGEVRVSLPDGSSYITNTYELAIDEIIQLFATLGAEVIGKDEDTSKGLVKRSPAGTRTLNTRKRAWRNTLRNIQRTRLAQLTTKNTEEENV